MSHLFSVSKPASIAAAFSKSETVFVNILLYKIIYFFYRVNNEGLEQIATNILNAQTTVEEWI